MVHLNTWAFLCMCFGEHIYAFLLCTYLEMVLLGCKVGLRSCDRHCQTVFWSGFTNLLMVQESSTCSKSSFTLAFLPFTFSCLVVCCSTTLFKFFFCLSWWGINRYNLTLINQKMVILNTRRLIKIINLRNYQKYGMCIVTAIIIPTNLNHQVKGNMDQIK